MRTATSPPTTTRTRVARPIVADPTSTALLLAGPAAMDLWPGVHRVGAAGPGTLIEAELGDASPAVATAAVRALLPQRTPTSFVTRFAWAGAGLPRTEAELVLGYVPGEDGPTTYATLVLVSHDVEASRVSEQDLQAMAEEFLDNLSDAAEQRSQAA